MSTETMPPEVFTLVDRMAAAFMRGDVGCARELVEEFRAWAVSDGRRQEQYALIRRVQEDGELYREGNAWFVTKDGLRVKEKITIDAGRYFPEWKRACRKSPGNIALSDEPFKFEPTEVRTYYMSEWGRDGLPVYEER